MERTYNADEMTEMHNAGYELGYERSMVKYETKLKKVKSMLEKRVDPAKILKVIEGGE